MSTFTKVLLATDLSPQADKLTECLFNLCPDTETEVVLAHIFDDDDDADPDGSSYKRTQSRLEKSPSLPVRVILVRTCKGWLRNTTWTWFWLPPTARAF